MSTCSTSSSSTAPPAPPPFHCSGKHKTRLLIGEGNFSFALALIRKHDTKAGHLSANSLGHSIVATELTPKIYCNQCAVDEMMGSVNISPSDATQQETLCTDCELTVQKIETLRKLGVEVKLGVDGTKIHEMEAFRGKTFARIHWNGPHDGSSYKVQTLPKILEEFFKACRSMQHPKDRVHLALAQPATKEGFYQGAVYNIARAASLSGYKLVKKRRFDHARYPEYQHVQTKYHQKASVTEEGMREFVFEKVTDEELADAREKAAATKNGQEITVKALTDQLEKLSSKRYVVQPNYYKDLKDPRNHYQCSSDDDSSDCEAPA